MASKISSPSTDLDRIIERLAVNVDSGISDLSDDSCSLSPPLTPHDPDLNFVNKEPAVIDFPLKDSCSFDSPPPGI